MRARLHDWYQPLELLPIHLGKIFFRDLDIWIFNIYEIFGYFWFTWARSFSEIWISMIIINTISTVSIGSLQFLTSYQSLGLPHEYVVALISFGGDLVTPCIKSSVYSYMPFYLSKVDHKLRDFCLKSNIYSYVHFFTFKLTICSVTSLSKATSTHVHQIQTEVLPAHLQNF